jgi:hypothetical protein
MRDVINNTSVDDIKSTLNLLCWIDENRPDRDPRKIADTITYLRRSLEYEPSYKNRISVIKMLQSKIKQLEKLL